MISSRTIERVKNEVDLVTVISELVSLKQRGNSHIGLCPFHSEKSPSFNVRGSDNFYHCFGCGASGNAISFVMHQRGLSFPDAIEYLANKFGIEIEYIGSQEQSVKREDKSIYYNLNAKALEYFQLNLIEELNKKQEVFKYVVSRSLNKQSLTEFKIGFCTNTWSGCIDYLKMNGYSDEQILVSGLARKSQKGTIYDTFKGRLVFPIMYDQTRVAGFGGRLIPEISADGPKYLNSPESPVYEKSKILYGFPQAVEAARSERLIYVVEGYMDVISLSQAGVKNVIAVCGTSLTQEHVKKISTISPRARLLFDNDDAGTNAAAKSLNVFLNSGIDGEVVLIDDGKDPDDLAKAHTSNTKNVLNKLPKRSLVESFILNEVKKSGHDSVAKLGAAIKGKIAKTVEDLLQTVLNPVERSELLKQTNFILGLTQKEQTWQGQKPQAKPVSQIQPLSGFEKEVLTLVLGGSEHRNQVLNSSEICSLISSEILQLISGLPGSIDDKGPYQAIMKHAHKIANTKDWNPEKVFSSILSKAKELLKEKVIKNLQSGTSEEEKLAYYQKLAELRRRN